MILKNVKLLFLLTFVISCSQRNESKYIEDDLIPPNPSLMSYFTVYGEDADQDGVRDDVEIWINEKVSDPNLKRALKFEAKKLGLFMKAESSAEINKLFNESIDASICSGVLSLTEADRKSDVNFKLQSTYLNNYWRRLRYREQFKMVEKRIYSGGDSRILHSLKHCKIKLSNLNETLQFYIKDDRYMSGLTNQEIEEFEKIVGIKRSEPLEPFIGQPSLRRLRAKMLREKGTVTDEEVLNAKK